MDLRWPELNGSAQLPKASRHGCCNGQQSQSSSQSSVTRVGIWLVNHGVFRNKIVRKPTKLSLDLHKQKSSISNKQNLA